jgi:acyl-CoA thioesterase FadM
MKTTSNILVQPKHIDELGHLNHVFAIQILEYARDDWYESAGLWNGRSWTQGEALVGIVLNINFNYRLECFLGDELQAVTSPVSCGNKSFILAQSLIKSDGSIAIDGKVTSIVMDINTHKTLTVPSCLAQYLPAK